MSQIQLQLEKNVAHNIWERRASEYKEQKGPASDRLSMTLGGGRKEWLHWVNTVSF